jgi:plastocyanin
MSRIARRPSAVLVALFCAHASVAPRPSASQEAATGAGPVGTIHGAVRVLRQVTAQTRRPAIGDLGMAEPAPPPEAGRPIVYLEKAPAGAIEERASGRARMTQRNETFIPHVVAVRAGTTVDFPNEDQTYHNVFSLSRTRRFDLGRYAAGQSKAVRFDQPGIVRVFCDIHSHMSAFVLVFNHRYFATANAEGRYAIPAVPPGRYTVAVWHEGAVRTAQTVVVPDHGGTVNADFEVR